MTFFDWYDHAACQRHRSRKTTCSSQSISPALQAEFGSTHSDNHFEGVCSCNRHPRTHSFQSSGFGWIFSQLWNFFSQCGGPSSLLNLLISLFQNIASAAEISFEPKLEVLLWWLHSFLEFNWFSRELSTGTFFITHRTQTTLPSGSFACFLLVNQIFSISPSRSTLRRWLLVRKLDHSQQIEV